PCLRIALGYPDLYEVGMSSLGIRILYGLLNDLKGVSCERFFAPGEDLETILRQERRPLFALESGEPLRVFDLVAFSLSSELNYTNVLNLLDLAGIPLLASQRGPEVPLILAGGSCTVNPMPLTPFVDAFVIGEGEEVVREIVTVCQEMKGQPRWQKLESLARLKGVYVPGKTTGPVARRLLADFNNSYFPVRWIVPLTEIIHDRISLEIMRGCPQGCRFCAAGYCWRPVRYRCPERIVELAREAYRWSGYEEISLLSFSSGDHPQIEAIVEGLMKEFAGRQVAISFPSLRVDTFSFDLASRLKEIRKTGLTFAPETSQRLRWQLGKKITDGEVINLANRARNSGWRQIKLYFMLGLPGETEGDLQEVVKLIREVSRIMAVHVSLNTFVPKAHTPLERETFNSREEIITRTHYLRNQLGSSPRIKLSFHPYEMSLVETFLGRGDEQLSQVLLSAWRHGARLE
ncbi:MAG TPA: radical SAM protein, partial [bacterium]|nr:radical SAM protein [bacterium]